MKEIRTVLSSPLYLPSIFTTAKSFRHNPVIGSRALNKMGLHVFRMIVSHAIFGLKSRCLSMMVDADTARFYRQNGYVLIENFLPDEEFATLRDEARHYSGEAWQCVQGDTITWRAMLDPGRLDSLPACRKLASNKKYLSLLKFCAGKNERPLLYIQQIQNGFVQSDADPQKNLHADTFHPTMKAWLFLQDVDQAGGPFTYVPGSNRLTRKRLAWEYRQSLDAARFTDGYSAKGSFRIREADLAQLGLPAPKAFTVKANTLVVANTHGFHRRGDVTRDRATRLEIWAMSRVNPFNPFVGLGIPLFSDWRDRILLRYLRRQDEKSRLSGKRASWHRAPVAPQALDNDTVRAA